MLAFCFQRESRIAFDILLEYSEATIIVDAYNNRAVVYKAQRRLDLALNDYNQALAIDPLYESAFYNRANLYREHGNYDLALADYTRAIALTPKAARVYINRSLVYKAESQYQAALADALHAQSLGYNKNLDQYILELKKLIDEK